MEPTSLQTIQNHIHDNKHLLYIVANPATDEVLVSYQDVSALTRFAQGMNVILRLLQKSRFEAAVSPFTSSLLQGLATKPEDSVQFIKVANGAIKSIADTGLHNLNRATRRKLTAKSKKQ